MCADQPSSRHPGDELPGLARLLGQVFGLVISEGAIANILARAEAPPIT